MLSDVMISSANRLSLQMEHDKGAYYHLIDSLVLLTSCGKVERANSGLCIGGVKLESFSYADDVSLFTSRNRSVKLS